MNNGFAIVLSGPSGTGKSTLVQMVRQDFPQLLFSISCTTRQPRPLEKDGVDYHFLSQELFQRGIERGDFLEYANVHGNFYGTPKAPMLRALAEDKIMLLDIDVQGARQVKQALSPEFLRDHVEFVFLAPPSLETLEQRLRKRGTESPESLQKRLFNAKREMEAWKEYQYLVVNDDLNDAAKRLKAILLAATCRVQRTTWPQEPNKA